MEVTAFNVGIDLKRHTVAVTNQSRNAEGDVVEDVWSAPTWKTEPTVPAGFDEMPPF
jgi:hypothetical protein